MYSWQYHYHPECELVCVLAGNGTRQVGNHAGNYENGDLVLMGPDLPHSGFGLNTHGMIEQVVVQFKKEVFAPSLLLRPEMKQIDQLLEKSRYGISFGEATKEKVMKNIARYGNTTNGTLPLCLWAHPLRSPADWWPASLRTDSESSPRHPYCA